MCTELEAATHNAVDGVINSDICSPFMTIKPATQLA
jgi:hypothetical protein